MFLRYMYMHINKCIYLLPNRLSACEYFNKLSS